LRNVRVSIRCEIPGSAAQLGEARLIGLNIAALRLAAVTAWLATTWL
jgi:hypothetical protein